MMALVGKTKKPAAEKVSRGIKNNNPGNIERTGAWHTWQGLAEKQPDKRFLSFETPVDGIRAIARTLITYHDARLARDGSKIDTIKEVIERWAPATENNTEAYIKMVGKKHPRGALDILNLHTYEDMEPLVKAIIEHENKQPGVPWVSPYSQAVIDEALRRVGVVKRHPEAAIKDKVLLFTGGSASLGAVAQGVSQFEKIWISLQTMHPYAPHIIVGVAGCASIALLLFYFGKRVLDRRRGIV